MADKKSLADVTESLREIVKKQQTAVDNSKQRDIQVEKSVESLKSSIESSITNATVGLSDSNKDAFLSSLGDSGLTNILDQIQTVSEEAISEDVDSRKDARRRLDILIGMLGDMEFADDKLTKIQQDGLLEAKTTRSEIITMKDTLKDTFDGFSDNLSFFGGVVTAAVSNSPILTFMTSQAIDAVKSAIGRRKEKKRSDALFIKEMIKSTKDIVDSNINQIKDSEESEDSSRSTKDIVDSNINQIKESEESEDSSRSTKDDGIGVINAVIDDKPDMAQDDKALNDLANRLETILQQDSDELSTEQLSDINIAISELPEHLQESFIADMQVQFDKVMVKGSESLLDELSKSNSTLDEISVAANMNSIKLLEAMTNGQANIQEFLDAATVAQAKQDLRDEEARRDKMSAPNSIMPDIDPDAEIGAESLGFFHLIGDTITTFLTVTAMSIIGGFKAFAKNSIKWIGVGFKKLFAPVVIFGSFFMNMGTALRDIFTGSNVLNSLEKMGTGFVDDVLGFISFGFLDADTFRGFFESMFGAIFDFAGSISTWVSDSFASGIDKLTNINWSAPFDWVSDKFSGFLDFSSNTIDAASSWLSDFGDTISSWFVNQIPDWVPDFMLPDQILLQRAADNTDLFEFDQDTFGKNLDDPDLNKLRMKAERMALERALIDPQYKDEVFDGTLKFIDIESLLEGRKYQERAQFGQYITPTAPAIKEQQMTNMSKSADSDLLMKVNAQTQLQSSAPATIVNQVSSNRVTNQSISQFRPSRNMDRSLGTYASAAHT